MQTVNQEKSEIPKKGVQEWGDQKEILSRSLSCIQTLGLATSGAPQLTYRDYVPPVIETSMAQEMAIRLKEWPSGLMSRS